MKHKLLSLIALAGAMFMSTGAFAQDALVADPVKPIKPAYPAVTSEWVTPEAGGTYYIYNVGSGQFLGCGNDWGTRAVTTTEKLQKTSDATWTVGGNKNTILPFAFSTPANQVEYAGQWFNITHLGTNKAPNDIYLCHEGNAAWVDGGTSRRDADLNGYWRIEAIEDGAFILRPHDLVTLVDEKGSPILDDNGVEQQTLTTKVFGLDAGNMGDKTSYTWTDLTVGATAFTAWKFIDAEKPELVEAILNDETAKAAYAALVEQYNAELAIYNARVALKEAITDATKAGIQDVNAAITVYNNENATLAELQKQNSHLRAEIAGLKYNFSGASEDNPLDVTDQVLVNPTFDSNNDGWTAKGLSLKHQTRTDGKVDVSKNWVSITGFIESWNASPTTLVDGSFSQTAYGLPKGIYILECDAMATRQGGLDGKSAEEAVEGAYIFVEGEEGETLIPVKAPDTQPKHWSVVFKNTNSDWFTFGMKTENTTANWISADNFKLTYYGETEKSVAQFELQNILPSIKELTTADNYKGYKPTLNAFEDQIANCETLLNGAQQADEAYQTAKADLITAHEAAKATIAAYEVLNKYWKSELGKYIDIAEEMGWNDLSEEFEELQETWEEAWDEGTMADDEIYAQTDAIYPKLLAAINPEKVEKGTDLTWLLKNPSFDDGTNGWTMTKDGGNTGTVSVDDKIDYHEVEFWRSKFDISQTIANMPAGIYEITVQGFSRNEDDQSNPNANIKIELYAGNSTAKFMNLLDPTQVRLVSENEPLWDGANPDKKFTIDGVEYYAPNGMGAASAYFKTDNPVTGEPYYTNHVNVTLNKKGDFTIGVRSYDKSEWTLFDNFKITYVGVDASIYAQLIRDKVDELDETYASDDEEGNPIYITKEGEQLYQTVREDALTTASSLTEENATELYPPTMEALENAIAYLKNGAEMAVSIKEIILEYQDIRMLDFSIADEGGFGDYLSDLQSKLEASGDEDEIENNEVLAALPEEIGKRWSQYVMEFTEENPYEDGMNFGNATEAIFNGQYLHYTENLPDTRGWTIEKPDSIGNPFTVASFDCSDYVVAEVYNATYFKLFQKVQGLKPGYYTLSVDGFYRPGASGNIKTDSVANIQNVTMFAESSMGVYTNPIKNVMAGAQEESLIGNTGGTESIVTLNDQSSFIPLNMEAAAIYLDQENEDEYLVPAMEDYRVLSIYRNDLTCGVGEDGVLTIGLTNNAKYINTDWTIFGNWQLTYLGTKEPVGVKSAEEKAANGVEAIFSLDGRASKKLQRGVNLVRSAKGVDKVLVP